MLSTLRGQVLLGAFLWTLGLLALWATALTFHPHTFRFVAVVHGYPNALMIGAAVCMAAGYAVVRTGLAPFKEMRRRLADVQGGITRQLSGTYPAEVDPLVRDLNALLAHHEAAVSRAISSESARPGQRSAEARIQPAMSTLPVESARRPRPGSAPTGRNAGSPAL